MRYERILFLFDPDADGIHCSALMLLFFDTYLQPLLTANCVSLIRPPQFEVRAGKDTMQALSEEHLQAIRSILDAKHVRHEYQRYRGLASLSDSVLREHCVDPDSRTAYLLRTVDAEQARKFFGADASHSR